MEAKAQTYSPSPPGKIRPAERFDWYWRSTAGPGSLSATALISGIGTATNEPEEYGSTGAGFGKRYALRMSAVASRNAIEAGLGAWWGEDPRYPRAREKASIGARWGNVLRYTVMAPRPDGRDGLAYARFAGNAGSSLLTNLWPPESDRDATRTLIRIGIGLGARAMTNVFAEFGSDLKRLFRRGDSRKQSSADWSANSLPSPQPLH